MLKEVIAKAQEYLTQKELDKITKAYDFAKAAHAGQSRVSGEPYIQHPSAVALILTELNQGAQTICAAFLHDVVEDTPVSLEKIKKEFGEETAFLVNGVTKLTNIKIKSGQDVQAENVRKMFLAMAEDVRIVFIKLADRLHNMRTLKALPKEKQLLVAKETRDIYAPLAHRLGLGVIKWELEDLSFRYLEPDVYKGLKRKISFKRKERQAYLDKFVRETKKILKEHSVEGEVAGRPKHFYSIYRKMQTQKLSFEGIYDLLAIRILLKTEADCYAMLGHIHSKWKPIEGKIKDYIAMPKANMYQSLHTTVIGEGGRPVEIQLRTFEMHHVAEYGVASHWIYKESDKAKSGKKRVTQKDQEYMDKMSWLRQLTEEASDSKDFMESIKTELLFGEVYVFSPKGDVYSLPEGATALDFAYQVHTDVGHRCKGAKVNNKIVPLETSLKSGDIVEVLTKKEAKPSSDWLSFVQTHRAKDKIKAWIYKQKKQQHVEQGRESLIKELKAFVLDFHDAEIEKYLKKTYKRYSFSQEDELYAAIGKGDVAAKAVARYLFNLYEKDHKTENEKSSEQFAAEITKKAKKVNDLGVSVEGVDSIMIKLAHCCYPLPGDNITGFVTMGYGITVHRSDCRNVKNLKSRKIDVFWSNSAKNTYPVAIEVLGFDRVGIFKDILNVIAEKDTNILEASAIKKGNSEIKAKLTLDVKDLNQLLNVIGVIKSVKDVYDVYRRKS